MNQPDLKLCGGCGKTPDIHSAVRWTVIECLKCKKRISARASEDESALQGAIKLWNGSYGKVKVNG